MAFFHLRPTLGTVWPALPSGQAASLWSAYLELDRTQWLGPAELEQLQFRQLRALLAHCMEHVPYYRHLLTEHGISPQDVRSLDDLRRIPRMTRQLFQAHASELCAGGLPPGTARAGEAFTSGTNGVPIGVLQTNRVQFWWLAFFLRDLEWCGLDPRGRLAGLRMISKTHMDPKKAMEGFSQPHWNQALAQIIETGPAYGMDIHQDPRRQFQWLQQIKPDYLLSLPSNLEFLAGLVQESGQRLPGLKAIQTLGETLTDETRTRIEEGFGVPVRDSYSCTEAGYLASPCPQGHGMHVHSENVLIEVLDEEDKPCLPGQTGRLVLTALHNFLNPFIRYEILDEVTLAPGPCSCGRGLPLFTRVLGRRHPLFHLPGGRRKIITSLYQQVRLVGGCHQFQIVQRDVEHVIVRVVPDRSWTTDHPERLRKVVCDFFEAPIRVDVEARELMELPAGGKLRIGVNEIEEREG